MSILCQNQSYYKFFAKIFFHQLLWKNFSSKIVVTNIELEFNSEAFSQDYKGEKKILN